jgi:hypothetical protein
MGAIRLHRAWRMVGAATLLGVGVVPAVVAVRPKPAVAGGSFSALAAADGVQVAMTSKGFLIVDGGSAGQPSAQAVVDSLGTSVAYAASPYPTDAALTFPGLAVSLGAPALPAYPLIAQSSHPTAPKATVEQGPVHLTAESAERSSRGRAGTVPAGGGDGGTGFGRSEADAGVVADPTGPVTSTAVSTVEAFSAGDGALRIGRVRSEATVVRDPDGEPKRHSALEVAQVTVAGQTVGFGEGGVVFPGGPAAVPQNPLAEALAGAGVTVRYLAPSATPDGGGIVSAGIEVQVTRQVTGSAPTTVSYVLGRSFAYVGDVTAPDALPDVGDLVDSDAATSDGTGPADGDAVATAAPQSGRGEAAAASLLPAAFGEPPSGSWSGLPALSGNSPAGANSGSFGASDPAGPPAGPDSGPSLEAAPAASRRPAPLFDVGGSYLVIVLAALALAGGAQFLRIMGVKLV